MLILSIPMPPMGKARPRLSRGRVHMPKEYATWKQRFAWHAAKQVDRSRIPMSGTLSCEVLFTTPTGNCRSDMDNAIGSVWDALQDAGIIANDRCIKSGKFDICKGDQMITVCLKETE